MNNRPVQIILVVRVREMKAFNQSTLLHTAELAPPNSSNEIIARILITSKQERVSPVS